VPRTTGCARHRLVGSAGSAISSTLPILAQNAERARGTPHPRPAPRVRRAATRAKRKPRPGSRPRRIGRGAVPAVGSAGSAPAMASSTSRQSSAVSASGPSLRASSRAASFRAGSRDRTSAAGPSHRSRWRDRDRAPRLRADGEGHEPPRPPRSPRTARRPTAPRSLAHGEMPGPVNERSLAIAMPPATHHRELGARARRPPPPAGARPSRRMRSSGRGTAPRPHVVGMPSDVANKSLAPSDAVERSAVAHRPRARARRGAPARCARSRVSVATALSLPPILSRRSRHAWASATGGDAPRAEIGAQLRWAERDAHESAR